MYEKAAREGVAPDTWGGFSQHSVDTQPLPTKHLSPGQVLKFRDEAFHRYFSSNRYLDMVHSRFGPKVLEHVKKMLEIRIERRPKALR